MADTQVVEDVQCLTAFEFVNVISPFGRHVQHGRHTDTWIFRGHGTDAWRLLPSALRQDSMQDLDHLVRHLDAARTLIPLSRGDAAAIEASPSWNDCNRRQWLLEARVVQAFMDEADRAGLGLPGDALKFRRLIAHHITVLERPVYAGENKGGPGNWPPPELLPLIGLAQHYSLPTRLLDWTRSAYVAAYFAALDACNRTGSQHSNSETLSVWAFRPDCLSLTASGHGRVHVHTVTVPRAGNPNLHAQDGLFTICSALDSTPDQRVDRRPMDEIVGDPRIPELDDRPVFQHFTLGAEQAGELLWWLDRAGVNGAKLFPDYGGAARAVWEARFHRLPRGNPPVLPSSAPTMGPDAGFA